MKANKILLLISSFAALVLLGVAAWQENVSQEWRVLQREYRDRLPPEEAKDFRVELRQIVVPSLKTEDRCVTCHLGMLPGATALPGHKVFGPHPDVHHDPADLGCVACHGGQGRAVTSADAHGMVPHWPTPMIPRPSAQAACGACHAHLGVPGLTLLEEGRAHFERLDCMACHALDGRGGTLRPSGGTVIAPDLSRVGSAGPIPDWYAKHLAQHAAAESGPWKTSFGVIPQTVRHALDLYLATRHGVPALIEAKAVFHEQGCLGCHQVDGVGGDDGPDLSNIGNRDPGHLDFASVPGARTLANWFRAHFRAPQAVVPGSAMPALPLSEKEIEALNLYLFSLRRADHPNVWWPRDRLLATRFGGRQFTGDGATLYAAFCAACHGDRGEGARHAGMAPFPAVANRDLLALATDTFLAETIRRGRPGRRMPAWRDAGLTEPEIQTLVGRIRELGGGVRPPVATTPARRIVAAATAGANLYAANCASCHGLGGEGGEGPALNNRVLLSTADDAFLLETILKGRHGTAMPAFGRSSTAWRTLARSEAEAIVAAIREWEAK
jgi:mono/diheme cytochrome c family protein